MATRLRDPAEGRYAIDPYAWALDQAALLRARRFAELDLEHLTEEVEDLAAARHRAVRSRTRIIIRHLLKLEHSPSTAPRAGWRQTIRTQRSELLDDLTPTLRPHLAAELPDLFATARNLAAADLQDHGETAAAATLAAREPYTLDQLLTDWWPRMPQA